MSADHRCPTCGHALQAPRPARRIECAGGCGLWWYAGKGRPRRWCDRCYPVHRRQIRKDCDPVRALNTNTEETRA